MRFHCEKINLIFLKTVFNDHLSVLMRTVHSCINRAPSHLLKEVILVNDHSTKTELYDELKSYLANNFEGKAHVVDLPARGNIKIIF